MFTVCEASTLFRLSLSRPGSALFPRGSFFFSKQGFLVKAEQQCRHCFISQMSTDCLLYASRSSSGQFIAMPRCEPANTLRTKKFREVCLGWIYYPYWQDLCPLSSDCSWSVFEVFKHCFMFLFCFFFPNFIDVLCGEIKLSTSEGVLHTYGHLWSTSYRGIHNQYILLYWINKKHILLLKWTSKTSYIPTCFIAANTYF